MGKRFSNEKLEQLADLIPSEEERALLYEADDPILWAEKYLWHPDDGEAPFAAKPMFHKLLKDPSKDRAARVGRQSGKTVHMVVDIMHTAAHETNGILLVFIPAKKQMNRMLEIMKNLLRKSDMRRSFHMGKKKTGKGSVEPDYDYEIHVSSGSVIRFFFMSHDPDKARGQRGTHIYMDEVEYLPEKAFPVILGVLKSNPDIKIWASSTPSGLENTWFRNFCESCADPKNTDANEYHLPTTMEENWPEIEVRLRDVIFDEVAWKLEVMAEWAEAKGAVYKKDSIDEAVERSKINGYYLTSKELMNTLEYQTAKKFIGVDWNNPQNGVRIVEIAHLFNAPWVVRNEKISYEDYTQIKSVERIMELYRDLRFSVISVDAGYGETQIELIHTKLVELNVEPFKVLNVVDANKREDMIIEYKSPTSGTRRKDTISVRLKTKLVNTITKFLEEDLTLLKEEDQDKDGLVREMRNFRRKSSNTTNIGFQYSDNTHSLSALQIALHGYEKYRATDLRNPEDTVQAIQSQEINSILSARSMQDTTPNIHHTTFMRRKTHNRTSGLGGPGRKSYGR